jgi:hypothetical protein
MHGIARRVRPFPPAGKGQSETAIELNRRERKGTGEMTRMTAGNLFQRGPKGRRKNPKLPVAVCFQPSADMGSE